MNRPDNKRAVRTAIEIFVNLLLIGIILIQKSKSEGLGLAFGAGMGETLFGSRAGNVLTRGTIVLTVVFMVNTLVIGILYAGREEKSLIQRQSGPPAPAPTAPARPPAAFQFIGRERQT